MTTNQTLQQALWKVFQRVDNPRPSAEEVDRLWIHPSMTERILVEHLDNEDAVASRVEDEQYLQLDWFGEYLQLSPSAHLLDVTCGPGLYATKLAQRGFRVTGVDFSASALAYARDLAIMDGVEKRCTFIEQNIRELEVGEAQFEAAILLYGQLEAHSKTEAREILQQILRALKPGGTLCLELLNQDRVDQEDSSWWYTDDQGVWGQAPYLHLGERFWYADDGLAIERYHIIQLETGDMNEMYICNQTYSVEAMTTLLREVGFETIKVYPAWDGLSLYDAEEWIVYVATRGHA